MCEFLQIKANLLYLHPYIMGHDNTLTSLNICLAGFRSCGHKDIYILFLKKRPGVLIKGFNEESKHWCAIACHNNNMSLCFEKDIQKQNKTHAYYHRINTYDDSSIVIGLRIGPWKRDLRCHGNRTFRQNAHVTWCNCKWIILRHSEGYFLI